jgi:hypothetical protein
LDIEEELWATVKRYANRTFIEIYAEGEVYFIWHFIVNSSLLLLPEDFPHKLGDDLILQWSL